MFEGLFQPLHLIIILVITLIIFGPGKLPELGRGLGKSIREFKKAMSGDEEKPVTEIKRETTDIKKEVTAESTVEAKKEEMPKVTLKQKV